MWSVKWSPNGELVGIAVEDGSANVLDFRSDEVIYTGATADESNSTVIGIL